MSFYALNADAFLRQTSEKSLLWNRRTSACLILEDAQPFLDALSRVPQTDDEIAYKVANALNVSVSDVKQDVCEFLQMLVQETFVVTDETTTITTDEKSNSETSFNEKGTEEDDNWTPLGSYFLSQGLPMEFHLDLTNGCTERCIHCYIPDYTPHFIPLELAQKALTEFREAGGLTTYLSGGECMMHPQFPEILRVATKLDLNVVILSNLTLCNDEMVSLLQETRPHFVNVSLYSMDPTVHDGITMLKGSWNRTMNAFLRLEKAGIPLRLASPIMKNNQFSFDDLKKFADEHHVHLIPDDDIFGQMNHDCTNQGCALSPMELEDALVRYKSLFYVKPRSCEAFSPDYKVCDIGKSRINMNAEGEYYPCDGCHGIVLGNVRNSTFMDIWQGEKLNALRALKNRDFGECATCKERSWCKVCPTRNFNETGNMFRHKPERCILAKIKHKIYGE